MNKMYQILWFILITGSLLATSSFARADNTQSVVRDSQQTGVAEEQVVANLEVDKDSVGEISTIDLSNTQKAVDEKIAENVSVLSESELIHYRALFKQAEEALNRRDEEAYFLLADQLENYPLYPYLQYQWLKKHLDYDRQIKYFLEQEKTSRYAPILKAKWLAYLGKKKQWKTFVQFYSGSSDTKLNCYYRQAQFNTGHKKAAMQGAQELWAVGKSQPQQCDALFSLLKKSNYFTQDLLWRRFDAALRHHKTGLAIYVKNLMARKFQATGQLWLNLHRHPQRYMPQFLALVDAGKHSTIGSAEKQWPLMFSHAVNRLASTDVNAAITLWDANKANFNLGKKLSSKIEKRLAFALMFSTEQGAYDRLSQLHVQDKSSRAWQVRIALREQNWPNVITSIQALSDASQHTEKWRYWLARAYLKTGEVEKAETIFSELSKKRGYYAYLAADRMNNMYQLSDKPLSVSSKQIADIKNKKEFQVAFELLQQDKKNDAKLQWWHALRQLDKKEILAASKLAKQWHWDEIAIFTIAKAKYWDDIELRFPLSYSDKILENAALQKLNPAILYGLIRRESAFNENAHSPAGARGLMQIMPTTGRQIARHFNDRWRGSHALYDPVKNLKYGAYYYQKLLKQFNGHYAVALAAYNAGPRKVTKWLPESGAMPADIWIETIPYRETREYVRSVLAYTLIYQQRTKTTGLTMQRLAGDVEPLAMMVTLDP